MRQGGRPQRSSHRDAERGVWIFVENRDPHRMAAGMLEEGRGKRKGMDRRGGCQLCTQATVVRGQRDCGRGRSVATEQVHLTGDSLLHFVLSLRVHMVLSSGRAESALGRGRVLLEA